LLPSPSFVEALWKQVGSPFPVIALPQATVRRTFDPTPKWTGPTLGVFAPVRDEAPLDQIDGTLAGFVVVADDKKLLAWCRVIAGRHVAHSAAADVEAVNNGEMQGARALDDASAHAFSIDQSAVPAHRRNVRK
jgi:hypothetical protein